jgi:hypothetical protein
VTRVEMLETVADDRDQVVILVLDDGGPDGAVRVVMGDPRLGQDFLTDRIYERRSRRWLTAADGVLWLLALPGMYSGSYLRARVVGARPVVNRSRRRRG